MTGFGRAEGGDDRVQWIWDLRSVNGRSHDVRLRMPSGFEAMEADIRSALKKTVGRGNISVTLTTKQTEAGTKLRFNEEALGEILSLQRALGDKVDQNPMRLDTLLTIRGLSEAPDAAEDEAIIAARHKAIFASFQAALSQFAEARLDEGKALTGILTEHLHSIEKDVQAAQALASATPAAILSRLKGQLAELLEPGNDLSVDRLHQEAALLATKADIREELDRLVAHIASARDMIAGGGMIGRKLDFLCQELNREANTLCSKAADIELTQLGLSLKSTVDQVKEQIQNVS